ncbi:MAG: GHKL domain-containing protein [Arcobacter sp.]|nr:GHKL domain-containing protein [Arcobacter sp.]
MHYAQKCIDSDMETKQSEIINKSNEMALDENGRKHYFEVFKAPFFENGKFQGLIGIGRDITDTQETMDKLNEALVAQSIFIQQSKFVQMGEMIENIIHQWRQPLSCITMISSGMLMKVEMGLDISSDELVSNGENVMKYATHMNETIEDFRNFLNDKAENKLFSISEAINQALSITKGEFKKCDIEVLLDIDRTLTLFGKKNELVQVIINMLNNAKDAMVENNISQKKIFIMLHSQNNKIIITIRDNGNGIPTDVIDDIFKAHFTTKKDSGTGVGLYMSKEIVTKSFSGELSAKNVEDGAEFKLEFDLQA